MGQWWHDLHAELTAAGAGLIGAADVADTIAGHEWHEYAVRLREWLERGEHGRMQWLAKPETIGVRIDPRERYPWIETAIAAIFPYNTLPARDAAVSLGEGITSAGTAKISRYAHGVDYHVTLDRRIKAAVKAVGERHADLRLRYYLDTGPVLERQWAERAGLGWRGRHSLLIHPKLGSYFFISIIFANALPPPEAFRPPVPNFCGSCTACVDACPTAALDGSGKLDARRCLSYLTIELRDEPAPEILREHHDGWLFGCDVCQQVCPWNRKAPVVDDPAFAPLPDFAALSPAEFAALTAESFRERFRQSPLWRPRHEKLVATLNLLRPLREG